MRTFGQSLKGGCTTCIIDLELFVENGPLCRFIDRLTKIYLQTAVLAQLLHPNIVAYRESFEGMLL